MKWVTAENAGLGQIACSWLIRRFADPDAEFLYAHPDKVLATAETRPAHSYDVPGPEYTRRDGKCTFEVIIEDLGLTTDTALTRLARIIDAADGGNIYTSAEAPGLRAIARGLTLLHGNADHDIVMLATPTYDALYAWCQDGGSRP